MCVNESTCVNTYGNYNCVCPEGYTGDGRQNGDGCILIGILDRHENKQFILMIASMLYLLTLQPVISVCQVQLAQ